MGEVRDWIFLLGKSFLVIVGGILFIAGLVETTVAGPNRRGVGALLVGLALAVPPLWFAFREAVKEAKRGRL